MKDRQPKYRQLARERAKAERKERGRRERGSALVVCEGECTEPYYLRGLLAHLGINDASVEVVAGKTDSNAVAVVHRARERFGQIPRDRVFVLVDAEQADLSRALRLCATPLQHANKRKEQPEIRIEPIVSTPCFEVWLLQHFRYSDQPFACFDDVLRELRADLPDYVKADRRIFLKVGGGEGLRRALLNTAALRVAQVKTGSMAPATDIDKLVEALYSIAPSE